MQEGASGSYKKKCIRLLAEKYPSREAVYERLIHLSAQLSLPKGVEHFLSDLHGEYDTFYHILNNCSGVIKEKVDYVFGARLTDEEKAEFCTLIYYPKEKVEQKRAERKNTPEWYRINIARLLELTKLMSYKFPVEKIKSFIPGHYGSIIVELMNTRPEADQAQFIYNRKLLSTICQVDAGPEFIYAFTGLVKRLAVDHMHIVGDFFDRGSRPDAIIEKIMKFPSLDIQWGNHDVLWMGAACGSDACIANVVRNNLRYSNTDVLEKGYGIGLRPLTLLAARQYPQEAPIKAAERVISIIMFKLEGQLIKRNPDFHMEKRILLDHIDFGEKTVEIDGQHYELNQKSFPTIDPQHPLRLSPEEEVIVNDLRNSFLESEPLRRHVEFLYRKGSMYTCYNSNLLFHGCVLVNADGTPTEVTFDGRTYKGREYFDYCDTVARRAWQHRDQAALDFMWYLWCGRLSPTSGREFKTFERMFVDDESTWEEPNDNYYKLINNLDFCQMVLNEFGLNPERGHIINGHVPVKVKKGETPVRSGGKVIIIDGGFCRAYHSKTGISGYTLISNSRGLRLLAHQNIADVRQALKNNLDIESVAETVELSAEISTVADTDEGAAIQEQITDLYGLLYAYQSGTMKASDDYTSFV